MDENTTNQPAPIQIKRRRKVGSPLATVATAEAQPTATNLPNWGNRGPLSRLYQEDRAVALIVFTIMLAALLGIAALVTDVGLAYVNRRAMQNAVDAAAMAGANYLPNSPDQALAYARSYANQNGISNSEIDAVTNSQYKLQYKTTYSPNDTLVVSAERSAPFVFREVVGGGDAPIFVTSTVLVTAQVPSTGLAPLAVSMSQVTTDSTSLTPTPCATTYVECTLKDSTNGSIGGNFQEINFSSLPNSPSCSSGSGGSTYLCYLETGYNGTVPTPVSYSNGLPVWNWPINTYPGNRGSNNSTGIGQLFTWDNQQSCRGGTQSCANLYEAPPEGVPNLNPGTSGEVCYNDIRCPRVVVVPMISQSWTDLNGNSGVTITNFSCFYITQQLTGAAGKSEIIGMFIDHCRGYDTSPIYGVPLSGSGTDGQIIAPVLWQ